MTVIEWLLIGLVLLALAAVVLFWLRVRVVWRLHDNAVELAQVSHANAKAAVAAGHSLVILLEAEQRRSAALEFDWDFPVAPTFSRVTV